MWKGFFYSFTRQSGVISAIKIKTEAMNYRKNKKLNNKGNIIIIYFEI